MMKNRRETGRDDLAELVAATAYQVVGDLLHRTALFDTPEGQRALDWLAHEWRTGEELLPWPWTHTPPVKRNQQ